MSNGWRTDAGDSANLAELCAAIDADEIVLRLVDGTYTNDDTDNFLDATTSAKIEDQTVTGNALVGWVWTADDVVYATVTNGDIVEGLVLAIDTGVESTSRIVGFIDRKADTTAVYVETNGAQITVRWPGGTIANL